MPTIILILAILRFFAVSLVAPPQFIQALSRSGIFSHGPHPRYERCFYRSVVMHTSHHSSPSRRADFGFTLVEVLVAVAVLGILAGSSIWALTQANNYASIARLYTGAETAAQNQIDYLLADSPFNPQSNELGTTKEWTPGTGAVENVTIYSEPSGVNGLTHAVIAQRVTTVTASNVVTKGQNLNLYSATVVVTYTYRSKNYRVQLNAMRSSDV